jgi:hypothetical protein
MNKYVFLDIDGVMVSDFGDYDLAEKHHNFNLMAVENLNYIVEKTNALIIISSCWRFHYCNNLKGLQDLFEQYQFQYANRIIDITPKIRYNDEYDFKMTVPRGCEIECWIRQNTKSIDQYRYVIIDDDGDMMLWQAKNFIQTETEKGLTFKLANDAIKILNEGRL